MENLHLGNGISVSAIMKSHKILIVRKNFKLLTPLPLKVWVSGFPSVNGNGISVSAIIKKIKSGHHFIYIDCTEKFQITNSPKFGSSVFQVSMEMEYQCWPL